jgi:hypothetical protein
MTSTITFNVGAPTFGMWLALRNEGSAQNLTEGEQSSRHYDVSRADASPFWNGASPEPSIILKANYLLKPSSKTFNVGAPTFSPLSVAPASCRPVNPLPRRQRYSTAVSQ